MSESGNSKNATVTDLDGNFTLKLSPKGRQIIISYIGMKTQTIKAVAGSQVEVLMEDDATTLGELEVVSVGYGLARRKDLTGSISLGKPYRRAPADTGQQQHQQSKYTYSLHLSNFN